MEIATVGASGCDTCLVGACCVLGIVLMYWPDTPTQVRRTLHGVEPDWELFWHAGDTYGYGAHQATGITRVSVVNVTLLHASETDGDNLLLEVAGPHENLWIRCQVYLGSHLRSGTRLRLCLYLEI